MRTKIALLLILLLLACGHTQQAVVICVTPDDPCTANFRVVLEDSLGTRFLQYSRYKCIEVGDSLYWKVSGGTGKGELIKWVNGVRKVVPMTIY